MLMKIIQQQQQHTFLGHVSKNHGLKNLAVSGKIEERRVSGHQRLKYLDICVHCGKITWAQRSSSGLQRTEWSGNVWSPTSSTMARHHNNMRWTAARSKALESIQWRAMQIRLHRTSAWRAPASVAAFSWDVSVLWDSSLQRQLAYRRLCISQNTQATSKQASSDLYSILIVNNLKGAWCAILERELKMAELASRSTALWRYWKHDKANFSRTIFVSCIH